MGEKAEEDLRCVEFPMILDTLFNPIRAVILLPVLGLALKASAVASSVIPTSLTNLGASGLGVIFDFIRFAYQHTIPNIKQTDIDSALAVYHDFVEKCHQQHCHLHNSFTSSLSIIFGKKKDSSSEKL